MNNLQFLSHPMLLSCVIAWFLAQAIKSIIKIQQSNKVSLQEAIFASGGMPSSHSAFVTALLGSIYAMEGVSTSFVIAFAFAMVTFRDAAGVRLAAGHHAKFINQLMDEHNIKHAPLCEHLGHEPIEVGAGIVVGILSVILATGLV